MGIVDTILKQRGYATAAARKAFLSPNYMAGHDPFLLPDMRLAVDRLKEAHKKQEKITIYGDYDIDGLTATTVLLDAFEQFGFKHVDAFIPNRFVEGYGMTVEAVERIVATGANLIITVDCGSLSHEPIKRAKELGVDVIVTDHHNVADQQPVAVAVVNPKRLLQNHPEQYENLILKDTARKLYPFLDLPGVGVAFKLVQALQTELEGLAPGHEKWLLDLVALGTVCDVVSLVNENRTHVYWGLQVLGKTKRPGLKALMAVAGIEPEKVNARALGFGLGPRMNAAGRLETAQIALDMLTTQDPQIALQKAHQLDDMNKARRAEQDEILEEALIQAEKFANDRVLVVSSPGWNHGIIGIVAAKLLEKFSKPTFVLAEDGNETKGSARSFGDFSVADAIRASDDLITKGGGHKAAAGVTLATENVEAFRARVNEYYDSLRLERQAEKLLALADAEALFLDVTEELIVELSTLEPFGNANPQPILKTICNVQHVRRMGTNQQHVKLTVLDASGGTLQLLAFSAPEHFFVQEGGKVEVWYEPNINEWQGRRSIEGRLLRLESIA